MLWEAWTLAKAYGTRPSEQFFIQDDIAAWCFDRAVHLFGTTLEAELAKAAQSAKTPSMAYARQQLVLSRWLGIAPKFRSPDVAKKPKKDKQQDVKSDEAAGVVSL